MLMDPYKSQSYTHNPRALYFWEHTWLDNEKEYYSNYWIKAKSSHSLCDGYQPYVSIYNATGMPNAKGKVYVKFFGRQAQLFTCMEKAIFYVKRQFDISVMDEFEYIFFNGKVKSEK